MKFHKKILLIIIVVMLGVFSIIYYAQSIAPTKFDVRRENLYSNKIPSSIDGMKIVFFSDIYYGSFMDETRLTKLVDTIQNADPDIVIFGGDVYDPTANINEESNTVLLHALQSIDAPYGKFYVYGDNDEASEETKNTVTTLLNQANFELLQNTSIPIHRNSSKAITIVGLDNPIHGTVDIESAYSNVSNNNFVLTVCHTPDVCDSVPADLTDYFIAGHSLGGQIYYFFEAFYQPPYSENYLRGQYTVNNAFTIDITNGTGTQSQDVRFMADSEIVVYTLHHTEDAEEDPAPTAQIEESPSETVAPSSTNEEPTETQNSQEQSSSE